MKNTIKLYGIIALIAVVVTAFAIVGCASAPKAPKTPNEIVFDQSIPEDQSAMLYLPTRDEGGSVRVLRFNNEDIKPNWISFPNPLNVKIPASQQGLRNTIRFGFHDRLSGGWFPANFDVTLNRGMDLTFTAVAGRNYQLFPFIIGRTGHFAVYEISQTREPNADEQVLLINYDRSAAAYVVILNKDTNDERLIYLPFPLREFSIIVPKGEHTIDIGLNVYMASWREDQRLNVVPNGDQPQRFTASSEPVRYSISTIPDRGNNSARYTLTRQ